MIPIIFLTETQLEPAEVKWMHGVRMRESYGIDVLRHVEHQGRITGATAHYTLASWGWLSRLLALPAPGCATPLGTSRQATQGQTDRLRRSCEVRPKVIGSGAFFSAQVLERPKRDLAIAPPGA